MKVTICARVQRPSGVPVVMSAATARATAGEAVDALAAILIAAVCIGLSYVWRLSSPGAELESTLRSQTQSVYKKLGVNSLALLRRYAALMRQEQEAAEQPEP